MKKSLHKNFLLDIVLTLFILTETKVNCGVIIVQSSSSSGFETYCNGLRCPPNSNCMAFTTVINGNSTSDKRCTNIYGRVIRQETVTVANGQMCIRNLTMVGEMVNVECSCRNLNNAEAYDTEHGENGCNVQETLHDALERQHDALEAANESEERYQEWRRKKLERENEEKIEVLYKAKDVRAILGDLQKNLHELPADALEAIIEQEAEERAELLEKQQGDLQKNLHEFPADALEEILEQEAEKRADLLEKQ
ncbi:hypothetical protein B7P43_G12218, partial [Cryptotermes secundus]